MTAQEVLSLLPAIRELGGVRRLVRELAAPDPEDRWTRSSSYSTLDSRIISPANLRTAIERAEEAALQQVRQLFSSASVLIDALLKNDRSELALELVRQGELLESWEDRGAAAEFYASALEVSLPLADKKPQIRALWRLGRIRLADGVLNEARTFFDRAAGLARDSNDLRGEVIVAMGLGNVLLMQARWVEAESCYQEALSKIEAAGEARSFQLELGQLCNNLGMVATRQVRFDDADRWFTKALRIWDTVDSRVDLAICLHNVGILRNRQANRREAHEAFHSALALESSATVRVALMVDLALSLADDSSIDEAQVWGRQAEQQAIEANSPYYLGHAYCALGIISRARGDDDGLVFFEKALQIAREKKLPYLEGRALREYALHRATMGGREEAEAYLRRAEEIFSSDGTAHELAEIQPIREKVRALAAAELGPPGM